MGCFPRQYADQFYAGKPAVITRKLGTGTVTYIGIESLSRDFETDILRKVFSTAGVKTESYDDQIFVDWRDGFWIATNSSSKERNTPIPSRAKLLVGTKTLPPGGVAVWEE